MTGTAGQLRVPAVFLEEEGIPLPPFSEQCRIVDAIENYFSQLDAAVASLERAQAKLKAYRASVLKAAVDGRLVPTEAELACAENRDYEPADVLLKRILLARRRRWEEVEIAKVDAAWKTPKDERWKLKYVKPAGPETDGLEQLPEGWAWATMPQLGAMGRGKSMHRPRNDPRLLGGPYPFVQTGDVKAADTWIRDYQSTYSEFGLAQSKLWPAGTMCITIAANIAQTAILSFDACFPDSVVGFVQNETVTTRYVEMFIRTAREDIERYAPATAQKNINLEILSRVAIPLPPLSEQRRIVDELDRLLSIAYACSDAITRNRLRSFRLRQAVLKWAFEGKLVEQDPTDEPAEQLLERIRADRPSKPLSKKTHSRRKAKATR
jgi:type I restriction enzyme S subunit